MIINADDFGLNSAVNQAIIGTHCAGVVTSTTLMVNQAGTQEAAELTRVNPQLGVGLHFNITLGHPVFSGRSSLCNEGGFYPRHQQEHRLAFGLVRKLDVVRELRAQFEALIDLGVEPTHIDSHQHMHAFPIIFDAVAELCREQGLPIRMLWVENIPDEKRSLKRTLRQAPQELMNRRNRRKWRGELRWNSSLVSLFDLGSHADIASSSYSRLIRSAQGEAVELMVHPTVSARDMASLTKIGRLSENEYDYLLTGELKIIATELGFKLSTYQDLV